MHNNLWVVGKLYLRGFFPDIARLGPQAIVNNIVPDPENDDIVIYPEDGGVIEGMYGNMDDHLI